MEKRVSFHTLGCRLNLSETGSIAQGFSDRGYKVVDFEEEADVVFLNTCTVTDSADSTCRNLIRKAQRFSPEAKIVVAGCYAQMEAEKISKMTGVDLILGNSEKYKVFEYLDEDSEQQIKVDRSFDFYSASTTLADNHTRAFLKIQDGCNYVCSFCIIPFARGRSRALSIKEALTQANQLIDNGFKEIILTGVNIGEFESASGEKLSNLVGELLEIKGLERLRLSSVEPNTITDELLKVATGSKKFLDHFHVPLQAGDDTILKNMRRKYTVNDYKNIIEKIKKFYPHAGIGADMIAGFPGETEEQFENTFNLVRELPITHFHVFPFSKRKNTSAAIMKDQIQHGVKKSRVKRLIMLGNAKLNAFMHENIGRTSDVLFETCNQFGEWEGYTTNYIRVKVKSDLNLKNQIYNVRLNEVEADYVRGSSLN